MPATNNAAERALRHAVMWRKISYGTQTEHGNRLVERLLSIRETCRLQGAPRYFVWVMAMSSLPTVR